MVSDQMPRLIEDEFREMVLAELYARWNALLAQALTMREPRGILHVLPPEPAEPAYASSLDRRHAELAAELKANVWRTA